MKVLIISFIVSITLYACGTGRVVTYEYETDPGPVAGPVSDPFPGVAAPTSSPLEELIYEATTTGEKRLRVKPVINSPEDLLGYRQLKLSQIMEILDATRKESQETPYYPVVVTMRRPISLSELNLLISRCNPSATGEVAKLLAGHTKALPKSEIIKDVDTLIVEEVKFVSTTGQGQLSNDTLSDAEGLARLEAMLAERELRYNGVTDYQLISGITSVRGGLHRDRVLTVQDEPEVFLADIGPPAIYEGKIGSALWGDIYQEVKQYGTAVETQD